MTDEQKNQITILRRRGMGYKSISETLDIKLNTIKSFCRRKGLTGNATKMITPSDGKIHFCTNCGVEIEQNPGRKEKRFCSDKCRNKWWNSHLDQVNRKAVYEITCNYCHKKFCVYGNSKRKYCSHDCYIADRFGGGRDE